MHTNFGCNGSSNHGSQWSAKYKQASRFEGTYWFSKAKSSRPPIKDGPRLHGTTSKDKNDEKELYNRVIKIMEVSSMSRCYLFHQTRTFVTKMLSIVLLTFIMSRTIVNNLRHKDTFLFICHRQGLYNPVPNSEEQNKSLSILQVGYGPTPRRSEKSYRSLRHRS